MASIEDKGRILKWLAIVGLVMAVFCIAILAIGYKEPSAGRLFTIGMLLIVSIVCIFLSTKLKSDDAAKPKYDVHEEAASASALKYDVHSDAADTAKPKYDVHTDASTEAPASSDDAAATPDASAAPQGAGDSAQPGADNGSAER